MDQLLIILVDLAAVSLLVFGMYYPRHRRRDLVVAFLTMNVGVLAVSLVLGSSAVGAGLGLGLFGVLSIIRLRSREIEQHEVAYYFAALALGLIGGLVGTASWLAIGLMALVVAVMAIADHPRLFRRARQQTVVLDRAIADERELTAELERLLGGRVLRVRVEELDLVDDTTRVDVRFEASAPAASAPAAAAPAASAPAAAQEIGTSRPEVGGLASDLLRNGGVAR